ncbi:uncharacterized protein LOC144574327 [Carex rostrata]
MPSRVLEWKSPFEVWQGKNGDILPLRTFGCICFVQDRRPNVGKLDPKAVKCVFVGYSVTQKGYMCWSPIEKRLFVSLDVTFRELEPYYTSEVTSPFGDSLDTGGTRQEGESSSSGEQQMVSVGAIPCPVVGESAVVPVIEPANPCPVMVESDVMPVIEPTVVPVVVESDPDGGGPQAQGELRVYTRRQKENEETVPLMPSPLLPTSTTETPSPSTADSEYTGDMIPLSTPPTPLSVRMTPRENAGIPPDRYGFPHDIAKFVSYSHISPVHGAFIASLDAVSIPKCWQGAKEDPKWEAAMLEELGALAKNKTWELV